MKMFAKKAMVFLLIMALMGGTCFTNVAALSLGDRLAPVSGYSSTSINFQPYSFEPLKNVTLTLDEMIYGDSANALVAYENMFNTEPGPDEQWYVFGFDITYNSCQVDEELQVSDIIQGAYGDFFYTTQGASITPIDQATWSEDLSGTNPYDCTLYPGGTGRVYLGVLMKKNIGYPLYCVDTGFGKVWFSTDPNYIQPDDIAFGSSKLSASTYTYTGTAIQPDVSVTYSETKLMKGTDYKVTYSGNTKPGIGTVTITGTGSYIGTVTKTFTIKPKVTAMKGTKGIKFASLTWTKATEVTGYQLYMSTSKNGTYTKIKTTSTALTYKKTGLTSGKTYYFKVRSYVKTASKTIYSDYSSIVPVKVK